MSNLTPGKRFQQAIKKEKPLPIVGTINAYCALLAEKSGFSAIYLSGAGVSAASYGMPDLGITELNDVLIDVRRITSTLDLPLLVDADTGFGDSFSIARTVKEMIKAGAAGLHIEDQVLQKRCGHRPKKQLVGCKEMVDRIKAAVDAKTDNDFAIMARTDSLANEGIDAAIDRAKAYIDAGADMLFPEAVTSLDQYKQFVKAVKVPVLANLTEFGHTPLFTLDELRQAGVSLALYPLTAFRAMSKVALRAYETIYNEGTQKSLIKLLQTREELYEILGYHAYEQKIDDLFCNKREK